ncbi:hypothetical protein ES731_01650 [Psychroflexus gondwanensis]|jgi:hypothetical protein|uniref:Lipoprotein n=1 Tax=Psychroflexus gondwanensis ACAM 44 TaxID=1189619 RepID=N1WZP5_9FLAO|nr:hypothetical protein [Psychroflexus gondwanensis]EMY82647.1 hypothetical protein pgond44_00955 [Psychroflexus gondwanensis ACAM 44]TXE21160.1 hypothetical protein ES731_01650 [Psychroflexus gondwanensis]
MKLLGRTFIVLFFSTFLMIGCDVNDDGFFQSSQVSPILSANVPDTMIIGESYSLEVTYQKDSDCHTFSNFDVLPQGDSLVFVRAVTLFTQASNCSQDALGELKELEFDNTFETNFTFKFLNDVDNEGEPVYIDKEVVVIE